LGVGIIWGSQKFGERWDPAPWDVAWLTPWKRAHIPHVISWYRTKFGRFRKIWDPYLFGRST